MLGNNRNRRIGSCVQHKDYIFTNLLYLASFVPFVERGDRNYVRSDSNGAFPLVFVIQPPAP